MQALLDPSSTAAARPALTPGPFATWQQETMTTVPNICNAIAQTGHKTLRLTPHSSTNCNQPKSVLTRARPSPLGFSRERPLHKKPNFAHSGHSHSTKMSVTRCSASAEGQTKPLTYKDAGVDIDAGTELVRRIAKMAPGIGGFGGLYPFGDSYLVAGTDGVGTKLKLAFQMDVHDSIGIDLVAMSVNDIVTSGAEPMFFLDYFASSRLDVDKAEQVIKGIVEGCRQSGCALLGGETAEMPGFYADGEYDLSGFAVGSVKKDAVINGSTITAGDKLVGLPSSGVHSNGFSLVRRVIEASGVSLDDPLPGGDGSITIGQALLAPTIIYVKAVLEIVKAGGVKGIAHITGGGFTDNIPRVFPAGLAAKVTLGSWEVLPVFKWLQQAAQIEDTEMFRTFNMGIGMVLVVTPEAATAIQDRVGSGKSNAVLIGEVVEGEGVIYS